MKLIDPTTEQVLEYCSRDPVERVFLEDVARRGGARFVAVLDGDDIVYVARVPVRRILSVGIQIGTRFPARDTSMGRVLLAALPERPADAAFAAELDAERAIRQAVEVAAGL